MPPARPSDMPPGADAVITAAEGVRETAQPPTRLTVAWFREDAERMERNLRRQYEPEDQPDFPDDWETELGQLDTRTRVGAMRRWAYLWHLWQVRKEGLERPDTAATETQLLAAYQLIRREPVPVRVGSRVVEVTDRSLACLVEMARHQARVNELLEDVARIEEDEVRWGATIEGAEAPKRKWARRYIQWLRRLKVQALAELALHRQAIFAHAFTESGAPATSREEAPGWWLEVTAREMVAIVAALNETGPGRLRRVGDPPPPPKVDPKAGRYRNLETFDFITPLARWGVKIPIDSGMAWFDRPLGQAMMFWRAAAEPVWEAGPDV